MQLPAQSGSWCCSGQEPAVRDSRLPSLAKAACRALTCAFAVARLELHALSCFWAVAAAAAAVFSCWAAVELHWASLAPQEALSAVHVFSWVAQAWALGSMV